MGFIQYLFFSLWLVLDIGYSSSIYNFISIIISFSETKTIKTTNHSTSAITYIDSIYYLFIYCFIFISYCFIFSFSIIFHLLNYWNNCWIFLVFKYINANQCDFIGSDHCIYIKSAIHSSMDQIKINDSIYWLVHNNWKFYFTISME
jgi:hypothetical protein